MSLISLFVHGEYSQLLLSSVALLFTFYALGRIIQQYFRYNKSNIFISAPIGMVGFLLLNQAVYTPIIITGLGVDVLAIVDTLKSISLLLFIIISYEAWFPKFNMIGLKTVALAFLSIGAVLVYYDIFAAANNYFAAIDEVWIAGIENIGITGIYEPGILDPSLNNVINGYQSTYYWIYLNSAFGEIDTSKVITIEMSTVWLTIVTSSILAGVVNNEKTIASYIVATIISMVIATVLGFTSPSNDQFYIICISIIVTMILYDYAKRVAPSEKSITLALFTTLAFTTIGAYSFAFFLIFGLVAITLSSIRGGNIVWNTINYLLLILLVTSYFIIAMFIHNITYITTILLYVVILGIVLVLLFLPLYSIGYTPSRRKELVQFEKTINEKIGAGVIVTALVLTLFSMFINFINDTPTFQLVSEFFGEFNSFGTSAYVGFFLYLGIIFLPTTIILLLWYFGKRNSLSSLFAFINTLLNPVTVSTLCRVLSISFSGEIILIPSMLMISIFLLHELTKRVPALH